MKITVQKISVAVATTSAFLLSALPASAQAVALCNGGSDFGALCTKDFSLSNIVNFVVILLLIVAVVLSLLFLIWGGIKWILSGGDKTKVESARSTIIGALIGLAIAFSAFFLLNIVANVFLGHGLSGFNLPTLQ